MPDLPRRLVPLSPTTPLAAMHAQVAAALSPGLTTRAAYEQDLVEVLNALVPAAGDEPAAWLPLLTQHPDLLTYDVAIHGDTEARESAADATDLRSLLCVVLYDTLYNAAMTRAPAPEPDDDEED